MNRKGTETQRNSELGMVNSERRIWVSQFSILYSLLSYLVSLWQSSSPA